MTTNPSKFAFSLTAALLLACTCAATAGPSDGRWRKRVPEGETLRGKRPIGIEGRVEYRIDPIGVSTDPTSGPAVAPGIRVRPLAATSGGSAGKFGTSTASGAAGGDPAALMPPIRVRIAGVKEDGAARIYDLRFIGEVEGLHDLRSSLERIDFGPRRNLPHAFVEVTGYFTDATFNAQLTDAEKISVVSRIGGYAKRMVLLLGLWAVPVVLALVWLLVGFLSKQRAARNRRKREQAALAAAPTFAEQLRTLIEAIMAGRDTTENKARLEAMLVRFWRGRLDLTDKPMPEALATLRRHPQAGELLRELDNWLHRAPGTGREPDLTALLTPYAKPEAPAGTSAFAFVKPELAATGAAGGAA